MDAFFNGINLANYCKIIDVKRGMMPPRELATLTIAGRPGQYAFKPRHDARVIEVEIMIIGNVATNTDSLATALTTDEPQALVFSDEPHKTYYGILVGDSNLERVKHTGRGSIFFLVPDAYAYGADYFAVTDTAGYASFAYTGNAPTAPIITATFDEDTPMFVVQNDRGEYVIAGDTALTEIPTTSERDLDWFDHMESLTPWSTSLNTFVADKAVQNSSVVLNSTSTAFTVDTYDSGATPAAYWYGGSIKRGLTVPLTDFEINMDVDVNQSSIAESGRIELYMLAADDTVIGKIAFVTHRGQPFVAAEGRMGDWTAGKYIFAGHSDPKAIYDGTTFRGSIRVRRKNNVWEFLTSRVINGVRQDRRIETGIDFDALFGTDLAQVVVHFGKFYTHAKVNKLELYALSVYDLNTGENMNVFNAGDVLTIDCAKGMIYRNGAPIMKELNPASTFFNIRSPQETIATEPARADVRIDWTERWL